MRYLRFCLLMLVAVAVLVVSCKPQVKEEPLLLLEESEELSGPMADNSRCHVCHINYDGEVLAVTHARADIGCEQCHGASDAHCSDEDNITPPGKMFAKAAINSFCKDCHPKAKLGRGKKYCTDCHGEHRLSHRTRRWDKTTGRLIEDDKVRMLTDEMLEQK